MFIEPYQLEEIQFAWCYRLYYRWQTHRQRPQPALRRLNRETLETMLQPYGIHILEAAASATDVRLLTSLLPTESAADCAGKIKGRVSRWLREQLHLAQPEKLLGRGYFACTTGPSTAQAVRQYLEHQGDHHGYASRPCPPVFVQRYPLAPADEDRVRTRHAVTVLQFHVVLATLMRHGVFGREAAASVAERWREVAAESQAVIEKVSFVPDHVHLATRVHPSVSPAAFVVDAMNAAQERMWNDFSDSVVSARINRLWQPGAYIGSYGDLESKKIGAYVREWERSAEAL